MAAGNFVEASYASLSGESAPVLVVFAYKGHRTEQTHERKLESLYILLITAYYSWLSLIWISTSSIRDHH